MFKNYLKIAFRNLWRNKLYSFLNIIGLASGIVVALLIGLWVFDELAYNTYNRNYEKIALVQKNRTYNGDINTETSNPVPLAQKLREMYGNYFEEVVVSSYGAERVLKYKEKSIIKRGYFMEKGGQEILSLQLLKGNPSFPLDPSSVLISESVSKGLFGRQNPVGEIISIDSKISLKIAGVYQDIPQNSTFRIVAFYGSFETCAKMEPWVESAKKSWMVNSFPIYVKIRPRVDINLASKTIKNALYNVTKDETKPELFLYPMAKWHLFPEFKNGVNIGSGLRNLWVFGIIGAFVLILACINFMNLSTARSEKRAKEIGIRKTIGSHRNQLIKQFYIETFLTVFFAGLLSLILSELALPWFNQIAEKKLEILWTNSIFWFLFLSFIGLTGFLSGFYPALYLSSFNPIVVLKGKSVAGKSEVFSRKSLVVFQFSISVTLIISTIIIYQQIQFAKNRPTGYEDKGLIQVQKTSPKLVGHFYAMRQDLHNSGAIVEMAESNGPITEMWHSHSGFQWKGKSDNMVEDFVMLNITPEFGKTVGWQILEGRDFSRKFSSDSTAIILNQSAVKLMGLKDAVNTLVWYEGKALNVVGISKDLVMDSPFELAKPMVFMMRKANMPFITLRLNPALGIAEALKKVENVLKKYDAEGVFNFKFIDTEFGLKFWREERMASIATVFAMMAIFISLLGIFGLATFIAEQRTKEIGIRKVLGASILDLWQLLSKDFVVLIMISFGIATPIAYYFMSQWLQNYQYRTEISWWIFALAGGGALLITLLTVSYQAIKAAMLNPVEVLKNE